MLKRLYIFLVALMAFTLLVTPSFAQETRDLTQEYDYSTTTEEYENQLYDALDDYLPEDTPLPSEYNYDYDYSNLTPEQQAALAGFTALGTGALLMIAGVSALFGLVMYVFTSWAFMVIANKLGSKNSWWAWVPVLNLVLMAELGEVNPWTLLLILVPVVNFFYMIYFVAVTSMKISQKRGLDQYLGLLMFVPLVQYIFLGYLAWGNITPKAVTTPTMA